MLQKNDAEIYILVYNLHTVISQHVNHKNLTKDVVKQILLNTIVIKLFIIKYN